MWSSRRSERRFCCLSTHFFRGEKLQRNWQKSISSHTPPSASTATVASEAAVVGQAQQSVEIGGTATPPLRPYAVSSTPLSSSKAPLSAEGPAIQRTWALLPPMHHPDASRSKALGVILRKMKVSGPHCRKRLLHLGHRHRESVSTPC